MDYFGGDYADFSSVDNVNLYNNNTAVQFTVDDLLDFSKDDDDTITDAFFDTLAANSADSSTVTAVESSNSSLSDGQFNGNIICRSFNESHCSGNELCVPYDDLAELEWLSNFVEESFSADVTIAAAAKTISTDSSSSAVAARPPPPMFPAEVAVPGKARSKRSRAAPCDWSSRLQVLSPETAPLKRREAAESTPGRRCLHCASEKTPQWRTGPMGPKTLCNACGVRFKSGRLVPEYRPASSPTFVSARHSNSHRKVLELRRQKDIHRPMIGGHQVFNGCDEFLIRHHNNGQDLRHVM